MFTVNGRFYSQSVTGVQRYARQIVDHIDQITSTPGLVALPRTVTSKPSFSRLRSAPVGSLDGYLWEQISLPRAAKGPILNLCNLAPVIVREQIVCIHDANIFTNPDAYSTAFKLAYRNLQPLIARRGCRVSTVSSFSAVTLAKYLPLRRSDISVIPNGHEHVHDWKAERSSILTELQGDPFILIVGSKSRHKNAEIILNAADEIAQLGLRIVVAGAATNILRVDDRTKAKNVVDLGPVSDDDLAALFEHATCFVFPSLSEGFGLPLLEAMALGCPAISSDRASMPEVGGSAVLYASPDNPQEWIASIARLKDSEDLRSEMRGLGLEQAKKFSWRQSAQTYLDLLAAY